MHCSDSSHIDTNDSFCIQMREKIEYLVKCYFMFSMMYCLRIDYCDARSFCNVHFKVLRRGSFIWAFSVYVVLGQPAVLAQY